MEGDRKEVFCGLDIPPMDFEYLEQWNSWDKQGIDIFNLFKGVDELEVADATANSVLESSQEKGKNGVKHAISGQDASDLSVCVPGRRRLKLRKMTTHDTDEKIVIEKSKTEVADHGRRKSKNKNKAINRCPAIHQSQESVEKDSKWKKLVADNMPRRQLSAELGCFKMSDLFKPVRKTKAGSDDATARNKAATKPQDSTEEASSSHEKLERAKPKRQDSYSKPIKKRCTQLMDYSSLPKPTQGNQIIEERATRKDRDDATARQAPSKPQVDSTEASCDENLERAKRKPQDSYNNAPNKRCTQLMDYNSLPKTTQGSYQKIEACNTRKDRNDATARQAPSKPQVDSTEASCDEKLEKAKRKPRDSYNIAPKRKCTQLMDYGSLPKPTQGSYQKIEVSVTRNRDFLGVHQVKKRRIEASCDEKLEKATRKLPDSYNKSNKRRCNCSPIP